MSEYVVCTFNLPMQSDVDRVLKCVRACVRACVRSCFRAYLIAAMAGLCLTRGDSRG